MSIGEGRMPLARHCDLRRLGSTPILMVLCSVVDVHAAAFWIGGAAEEYAIAVATLIY